MVVVEVIVVNNLNDGGAGDVGANNAYGGSKTRVGGSKTVVVGWTVLLVM